jgi:hypothetical protein
MSNQQQYGTARLYGQNGQMMNQQPVQRRPVQPVYQTAPGLRAPVRPTVYVGQAGQYTQTQPNYQPNIIYGQMPMQNKNQIKNSIPYQAQQQQYQQQPQQRYFR